MLLLVLLVMTGCTSTYKTENLITPKIKLQRSYTVAIERPPNGRYGEQTYAGSGKMTADALKREFLRYSSSVKFVSVKHKRSDFSGRKNMYYVDPEILHWEDRATEWSGKCDRIEVKIDIYNTSNMEHESSVIFSGKSKWATFGGDHPQDLLQKPIQDYIKTLY